MNKADNKPYDEKHKESEKKSSSRERELVSSSSSSNKKMLTVRRVVKGREKRIGIEGVSLPERFSKILKVDYDATVEKVQRAKWFLKHKAILELVREMQIAWGAQLYDILDDMGYKISKMTIFRLLDALVEYNIVYDFNFFPMSKILKHHRFYITYDCPEWKIERYIGRLVEKDEWGIKRNPPKLKKEPKEIVSHNIEVKRETIIQTEVFDKEEKQKLIDKSKCEHGFLYKECGKDESCPNYKWKKSF